MAFSKQNLIDLIKVAVQHNASDVHIRAEETPCLRIRGELVPIQTKKFSMQDVLDIAAIILNKKDLIANLPSLKEYDGGFAIPSICRIRYNLFRYNRKLGIILRIVSMKIPSIDQLQFPKVLKNISLQHRGLVLVTGPTGSGKSTTLAAMIDYINNKRHSHIVTIEDPIEYLHTPKKSRLSQREVGRDTPDFSSALRAALRQDPDVILIGEMRDPETVQIALKAAETGHIVFSTVHTTHALATIGRIISMFPTEEQEDVRKRLSVNLYATISQRMLKTANNKGVAVAMEIMVTTPGVKEVIEGQEPLERLIEIIQENYGAGGNGSQSFDQDIMALYEGKIITKETALDAVSSQSDFLQKLDFT